MVDYSGFFPQADGVTDLVMDVAGVTRKTSAKAVSFKSSHHIIIIIIYVFLSFSLFLNAVLKLGIFISDTISNKRQKSALWYCLFEPLGW